jgi:acetyltransferase-like isoleucine patch superfamily enzyme
MIPGTVECERRRWSQLRPPPRPAAPPRTRYADIGRDDARPVLVYGGGCFSEVVRELVTDCGRQFAGFVNDWMQGPEIVGGLATLLDGAGEPRFDLAMAIGYRHLGARFDLYERLKAAGYRFPALVHPLAHVARTARVADGAFVMARAVVDTGASVRELAVLWPAVTINHDSEVGANTFVSPGAIVCGVSRVGSGCFVGAGAVVTDHVDVADGTFVKAASRYSGGPLPALDFGPAAAEATATMGGTVGQPA